MTRMQMPRPAVVVSILSIVAGALFAAGCQRAEPPPKPVSMASTAAEPLPPAAQSTKDPSLPDAETALAAQAEEAKESDLSQGEIRRGMPLPGQANDHSTEAFEKKTDATSGNKNDTPGDKESASPAS